MTEPVKKQHQLIDDCSDQFAEALEQLDISILNRMKTYVARIEQEETIALDQLKYLRNEASKPLDFVERTIIAIRAVTPSWIKVTKQITGTAAPGTPNVMRILHSQRNLSSLIALRGFLGYEINLSLRFDDRSDLPDEFYEDLFSRNSNSGSKVYEWITTLMYPIRRDVTQWGESVKLASNENTADNPVAISSPWGIAIHPKTGHIYTTDHNDSALYIWSHEQDGKLKNLTTMKEENTGNRKDRTLVNPRGIAISKQGRVAIADYGACRLTLMTDCLKFIRQVNVVSSSIERMSAPYNVVFDKEDNIYLSDSGNQRVLKFNHDGNFLFEIRTRQSDCRSPTLTMAHGEKLFKSSVNGIAVDEKNRLLALTSGANQIRVFRSDGYHDFDIPINAFGSGGWGFIARGPEGVVVVSDYNNSHVRFYKYSGELVSQINCKGPLGCVFDPKGRFYFLQHDASAIMCV